MIDAGAWVSEEHAPTSPLREPSVFNDLSSGVGVCSPPPPALSRQENFQYCAWWFHVTNPLSWLLILLAIFLTTLYPLVGKGRKLLSGAEARLLDCWPCVFSFSSSSSSSCFSSSVLTLEMPRPIQT